MRIKYLLLFFLLSVSISTHSQCEAIACWGDSKTQGEQEGPGLSYPSFLQAMLEKEGYQIQVHNYGAHGELSTEIMQRQGSFPLTVQPFVIPASSDEEVKISINSRLRVPDAGCNPCFIDGIEGSIRHDWTDRSQKTFYFKRNQDGSQKEITTATAIITDAMVNHRNEILILDIGYNGGFSSINNWIAQYQKMIDYSECKKFIIIGRASHFHGPSVNTEDAFSDYFGDKFINLRDYYVKHGLEDAGITPTDGDLLDISRGIPPRSLFYDEHHENIMGYTIKANLVYQKLKELNYIP